MPIDVGQGSGGWSELFGRQRTGELVAEAGEGIPTADGEGGRYAALFLLRHARGGEPTATRRHAHVGAGTV